MRTLCVSVITVALLGGSATAVTGQEEDPTARPPIASVGCGSSEVGSGVHRDLTIEVDGDERQWAMSVPEAHDGVTPLPLWLQFHGVAKSMYDGIATVGDAADENGFVVVAPQAAQRLWMYDPEDVAVDVTKSNPDVAFVDALIDHLSEQLCLDLARVYAAGFSSGGDAVSVLTCALEERIAAVAPAAGPIDFGESCEMERPVPVLAISGTADDGFKFDGGSKPGWEGTLVEVLLSKPVPEQVTGIAVRNGCEPEYSAEVLDVGAEAWAEAVERWTWDCPPGADVELIVHGGGHVWPAPANVGFSATELVWEFFEQHPLSG